MSDRLAICPACKYAFRANGALPKSFCERCGAEALVSDGTPANLIHVFNVAHPSATPRKLKREVWGLAERIARGEVTVSQAFAEAGPEAKVSMRENFRDFVTFVTLLLALFMAYQQVDEDASDDEYQRRVTSALEQIQLLLAEEAHEKDEPTLEQSSTPEGPQVPLGESHEASTPHTGGGE